MHKYILTGVAILPLLLTFSHAEQRYVGERAVAVVGIFER